MIELFRILESNGWSCEPHNLEPIDNVNQWKIQHDKSQEIARLWEVKVDNITRYIVFWGHATKVVTESPAKGIAKSVEYKLLIDYADDTEELSRMLKTTLSRLHPKMESSLVKAKLVPGFDMLGGDE
jgi:hypothetical protein